MESIIWTNGKWLIDNTGCIWLDPNVINRKQDIPTYVFKKRNQLMNKN